MDKEHYFLTFIVMTQQNITFQVTLCYVAEEKWSKDQDFIKKLNTVKALYKIFNKLLNRI